MGLFEGLDVVCRVAFRPVTAALGRKIDACASMSSSIKNCYQDLKAWRIQVGVFFVETPPACDAGCHGMCGLPLPE